MDRVRLDKYDNKTRYIKVHIPKMAYNNKEQMVCIGRNHVVINGLSVRKV